MRAPSRCESPRAQCCASCGTTGRRAFSGNLRANSARRLGPGWAVQTRLRPCLLSVAPQPWRAGRGARILGPLPTKRREAQNAKHMRARTHPQRPMPARPLQKRLKPNPARTSAPATAHAGRASALARAMRKRGRTNACKLAKTCKFAPANLQVRKKTALASSVCEFVSSQNEVASSQNELASRSANFSQKKTNLQARFANLQIRTRTCNFVSRTCRFVSGTCKFAKRTYKFDELANPFLRTCEFAMRTCKLVLRTCKFAGANLQVRLASLQVR